MLEALVELCVRRRAAVMVLALGVAVLGIQAYRGTSIEAYPDVTNIQVNVIAQMPGQAPEEIERQVTVPLERVLNGVPGMLTMRSESLFGLSLIWLVFQDDADGFKSRNLVNERLTEAELPEGVQPRLAPDDTPLGEIYQYTLKSDRHTPAEIRAEQEWTVSRLLRQVPGVADVVNFGGYLEEVHVLVDPARLVAHDLTLGDVAATLEASNRNVGGGFLRSGDQELVIRGIGYLRDPREVGETVLRSERGTPVTVADVATIVRSHMPRRGDVGAGLDPDVTEGFVLLRRGENPSRVLEGVHAQVDEINAHILPEGMTIVPFYDRTTLVDLTLATVHHSLIFGALLVGGVIWLFLRSLRCSLIVTAIIPLALLTAFIGLSILRLPANLISMGAIDFGILVDGAVVLVENVLRAIEEKRPAGRAALLGLVTRSALDVSRPTLFAMAIIIAALIPVFTLERVEGRIFRPLALTYTFALIGGLVFALTLVPALCAAFLRLKDGEMGEPKGLVRARDWYRARLRRLLARRPLVLGSAFVLLALAGLAAWGLGSEFLPELDEGDFVIFVEMPPSIALDKGTEVLTEVRRRLLQFPEVLAVLSEHGRPEDGTDDEGVNMSETFVRLKPRGDWPRGMSKDRLIEAMRASLELIPGVEYNFSQPIKDNVEEAVSGVRGKIVLKIFGYDLQAMRSTLLKASAVLAKVPGIVDLDLYRDATVPQLQVELDRAALARSGITVSAAQDVVETALEGRVTTRLWSGERPVPVRLMLPLQERQDPSRIAAIQVPAGDARVPLGSLANIGVVSGRAMIAREGGSRFLALKFNVEGRDMGSVVKDAIAAVAKEVPPPAGHYFVWGGEFESQARAMSRLAVIVPISFLVVFALLSMSLQSVWSAAAVALSSPFAMTGGVFALRLCGIPLSVSAAVGFVALLGQVSLASLLVISAVDAARASGAGFEESILEGASARFRAVLMTASLAILGLTPMAVSQGVGSEIQRPFAVVIIGGLATSIAVTLFVLPVIHSLLVRRATAPPAGLDETTA
ncbi:MAG TPA: CusA/CzcA family heavy metal efflux RND transporter [Verrucomicrobiae bacterium]|nr:CusA/CzcA family heavy metal efflux RND transporter [Verrucomicrobiae bacterium]